MSVKSKDRKSKLVWGNPVVSTGYPELARQLVFLCLASHSHLVTDGMRYTWWVDRVCHYLSNSISTLTSSLLSSLCLDLVSIQMEGTGCKNVHRWAGPKWQQDWAIKQDSISTKKQMKVPTSLRVLRQHRGQKPFVPRMLTTPEHYGKRWVFKEGIRERPGERAMGQRSCSSNKKRALLSCVPA